MNDVSKQLLQYLHHVMYEPAHAKLDLMALPEEFRALGEGLMYFTGCVMEATALAEAIAQGNLDVPLPPASNEIAAPVKSLHAALKHLTWQTQQVAKGDYHQRMDFLGDFSLAFNDMVAQLAQQRATWLSELENRLSENRNLLQNKNMYEQLVGQLEQWVVMVDTNTGEWLFVSNEPSELSKCPHVMKYFRQWVTRQVQTTDAQSTVEELELELEYSGIKHYYSVSIHPIYWHQHMALAFIFTDISREKRSLLNLQEKVNKDALTKLYNRNYAMQILNEWLTQGKHFVLAFIDIDNLKEVNDYFGHMEGDGYIMHVAKTLSTFSDDAVVCRFGGDEFLLLIEGWSMKKTWERLEALRKCMDIHGSKSPDDSSYVRSVSFGLIRVNKDNVLGANDLISIADQKMYEYKRSHKRGHRGSVQGRP